MKNPVFLDNTRISAIKTCPMYYNLRHNLAWVSEREKPPLGFGGAWHEGKGEIFRQVKKAREKNLTPDEDFWSSVFNSSCLAFMREWEKRNLPPESNADLYEFYYPRVPGVAFEMLRNYISLKKDWLFHEIEILSVEEPFLVYLFETEQDIIYLVGRRDATIRSSDGVWALEHKTTTLAASEKNMSKGFIFQTRFLQSFNMSPQVSGYTYSLQATYGKEARGVIICGDLVHKTHQDKFVHIPIWKSPDFIESWYNDTIFWVRTLLTYKELNLFPHNECSCETQFGPCDYRSLCESCPDPSILDRPFAGFKVEPWEPFDESELKSILETLNGPKSL